MSERVNHTSPEGWANDVVLTDGPDPIAYVPGELLVGGARGRDAAVDRYEDDITNRDDPRPVFEDEEFDSPEQFFVLELADHRDAITTADELRADGVVAEPNHVLFANAECCCRPHPAQLWHAALTGSPVYASPVYASPVYASPVYASPVYASPVYASPVYASPVYASPVYASPVYASPVHASEYRASGKRNSTARPASAPTLTRPAVDGTSGSPRVAVLDTGIAVHAPQEAPRHQRPELIARVHADSEHFERPDENEDDRLDPAAGHGTFIVGIIELLAPGCGFEVRSVLTTFGDGKEDDIARQIDDLPEDVRLINLSFGGYARESMFCLEAAIRRAQQRGAVVVAAAGNDGTCRPQYPAAIPGVVSVGALDTHGPAAFSNYGPWVRACAPGADLVSSFFKDFDGPEPAPQGGTDPDRFESWARWSGTSFAAPVVTAMLAREMQCFGVEAKEAVQFVVDAPGLFRIPDLGTVVNPALSGVK